MDPFLHLEVSLSRFCHESQTRQAGRLAERRADRHTHIDTHTHISPEFRAHGITKKVDESTRSAVSGVFLIANVLFRMNLIHQHLDVANLAFYLF